MEWPKTQANRDFACIDFESFFRAATAWPESLVSGRSILVGCYLLSVQFGTDSLMTSRRSRSVVSAEGSQPRLLPVPRKIHCVLSRQANEPRGGFGAEEVALDLAEIGMKQRLALVGEADLAGVEGCVPERRQEYAVVDVEALGVVGAFGPGHDVRCAKEGGIARAGQRALAVPVFEQRFAEDILPDALHDEPFSLGRARQSAARSRKT